MAEFEGGNKSTIAFKLLVSSSTEQNTSSLLLAGENKRIHLTD